MRTYGIQITRTLLEKPKELLTEKEKLAIDEYQEGVRYMNNRLKQENKKIVSECKILCSGGKKRPIPEYGWIEPVKKLCYLIEHLNILYKKYGVSVILEQSKEKYAELRFYTCTNVESMNPFIRKFNRFVDNVYKIDFGQEYIKDTDEYRSIEWKEISKKEFDDDHNEYGIAFGDTFKKIIVESQDSVVKNNQKTINNDVYFTEENGKYYKSYVLYHPAKYHVVFKKHNFIRKCILPIISKISNWVNINYKETHEQAIIREAFEYQVREFIENATDECKNVCQHCGMTFGKHFKKYETCGWFTYTCESCALERGGEYIDVETGKHYIDGIESNEKENEKT